MINKAALQEQREREAMKERARLQRIADEKRQAEEERQKERQKREAEFMKLRQAEIEKKEAEKIALQEKQEQERQKEIKQREQEQKRKHSEFLRQTEKAFLDHQRQLELKKREMEKRDEERQRAMIQHQKEQQRASLERRAVTERKIEITRKNAENMLNEQKKSFEEKEHRAELQRLKFERQRLNMQKELHRKGELKQKVIQEVIERDKELENFKKKKFFEKEHKAEIRRKELEKEAMRELSEKKKKEEERDCYIQKVRKQMEIIENTRKKRILSNMEEKEYHLLLAQKERDKSLSQKREENRRNQNAKNRNVEKILKQQDRDRAKTLENLEKKSRCIIALQMEKADLLEKRKLIRQMADIKKQKIIEKFEEMKCKGDLNFRALSQMGISIPDKDTIKEKLKSKGNQSFYNKTQYSTEAGSNKNVRKSIQTTVINTSRPSETKELTVESNVNEENKEFETAPISSISKTNPKPKQMYNSQSEVRLSNASPYRIQNSISKPKPKKPLDENKNGQKNNTKRQEPSPSKTLSKSVKQTQESKLIKARKEYQKLYVRPKLLH